MIGIDSDYFQLSDDSEENDDVVDLGVDSDQDAVAEPVENVAQIYITVTLFVQNVVAEENRVKPEQEAPAAKRARNQKSRSKTPSTSSTDKQDV